jgi:hypothetical protein
MQKELHIEYVFPGSSNAKQTRQDSTTQFHVCSYDTNNDKSLLKHEIR